MEASQTLFLSRTPKFSGEHDESWDTWIHRFEALTESSNPKERLSFLFGLLDGKALDVAVALPPKQGKDYAAVKEALKERFAVPVGSLQAFAMLSGTRRQPGEAICDFGDRVSKLAGLAFLEGDPAYVSRGAVHQFTCGLNDTRLQALLIEKEPTSMEEAVRIATAAHKKQQILQSLESTDSVAAAAHQGAGYPDWKPPNSGSTDDRLEMLQQNMIAMTASIQALQNQANQKQDPRRPPRMARCFKCQEVGHFRRNCPQLGSSGAQGQVRRAPLAHQSSGVRCLACGAGDHWMVECPRLPNIVAAQGNLPTAQPRHNQGN